MSPEQSERLVVALESIAESNKKMLEDMVCACDLDQSGKCASEVSDAVAGSDDAVAADETESPLATTAVLDDVTEPH